MKVPEEAGTDYGIITISQLKIYWVESWAMLLSSLLYRSLNDCWYLME